MTFYRVFATFCLLAICLCSLPFSAEAQLYDTTRFSVTQEGVPANDSGGRWVKITILLKNLSASRLRVYNFHLPAFDGYAAPNEDARLDDSALYRADSLFVNWRSFDQVAYDKPWQRKDSIAKWGQGGGWSLSFALEPFGTARVPIWVMLIGSTSPAKTATGGLVLDGFSDTTILGHTLTVITTKVFGAKVLAPCAPPPILTFKSLPLSNPDTPAVYGGALWRYTRYDPDTLHSSTTVSYAMVGEYANRFTLPASGVYGPSDHISFTFNGAPQQVVHDTLITSMTTCWGTRVTRTPIEAHSVISMRNLYTLAGAIEMKAPFLGMALDTFTVTNTADFPIRLVNVQVKNYRTGQRNFRLESVSGSIPALGTGEIIVAFLDNDKVQDTHNPNYDATLSGVVEPDISEPATRDSAFSVNISGVVDVYCPYMRDYVYRVPRIESGVHPAGIVFLSNTIHTSYVGGSSFLTIFSNNDSNSQYFYPPYYDDPHFTITVHDFTGLGCATLPGIVTPDTDDAKPPFIQFMQALTQFTGDDDHNYLTQLHWPREHDTITMDVLALGANASPFDAVRSAHKHDVQALWPNPTTGNLNVAYDPGVLSLQVIDILGNDVLFATTSFEHEIDLSHLPDGIYLVVRQYRDGHMSSDRVCVKH